MPAHVRVPLIVLAVGVVVGLVAVGLTKWRPGGSAPGGQAGPAAPVTPPAGDVAVISSVAIEGKTVTVKLGWPAAAAGNEKLLLLAAFGTDAAGLDRFVDQTAKLLTMGISGFSVSDTRTGKGIFTSSQDIRASERPAVVTLSVPDKIGGAGMVATRLYAISGETMRPVSNTVETPWSGAPAE
jgi:hypothetical protein